MRSLAGGESRDGDAMRLQLDSPVRCAGDVVGKVADVVIEPVTRRLTHVVVETEDKDARLVPLALVSLDGDGRQGIALACTEGELRELQSIRDFAYLHFDEFPSGDADSDVGVEEMLAMPSLEMSEMGNYIGDFDDSVGLTYDRIPKGESELRRSSFVRTADGHELGQVAGFVVQEGGVTHIVIERGHLWWARDVAIPIEGVERIATDSVTIGLSKDEVKALPPLPA